MRYGCTAERSRWNKVLPVPNLFLSPSLALLPYMSLSVLVGHCQGVRGRCWFKGERAVGAHDFLPVLFVRRAKVVSGAVVTRDAKAGLFILLLLGG